MKTFQIIAVVLIVAILAVCFIALMQVIVGAMVVASIAGFVLYVLDLTDRRFRSVAARIDDLKVRAKACDEQERELEIREAEFMREGRIEH